MKGQKDPYPPTSSREPSDVLANARSQGLFPTPPPILVGGAGKGKGPGNEDGADFASLKQCLLDVDLESCKQNDSTIEEDYERWKTLLFDSIDHHIPKSIKDIHPRGYPSNSEKRRCKKKRHQDQ